MVLDIQGDRVTVLVHGGRFRQIRLGDRSLRIGQEIMVPEERTPWYHRLPVPARVRLASVVAVVLIAVLMPVGYLQFMTPGRVMAYVNVDINPSLRLGIDLRGRVVEMLGLDQKGNALAERISWQGKPLEQVVAEAVRVSQQEGYVPATRDSGLIVTVTPKDDQLPKGLQDRVTKLEATVSAEMKKQSVSASVKVIRGDKELSKKAEQLGWSPGEVALLLEAIEAGLKVSVEDVRGKNVQEAVSSAGGKIDQILSTAKNRDRWEALLEKHQEKMQKQPPGQQKPPEDKKPPGKPDDKPEPGKPGEGKPGEGKPGESKPGEGKPGEGKPGPVDKPGRPR